jgi:sec-independent protein translocase protein TatC
MPLIEHLVELRSRIVRSALALSVGVVIAFASYNWILGQLVAPYCDVVRDRFGPDRSCALVVTSPLDGFTSRIRIATYVGFFLASPVILYQFWRFITPGLKPKERRYAVPFVASSIVLFSLGAAVAFWTLPKALDFLIGIAGSEVEPLYSPSSFLRLVVLMMVGFGLAFEFPVLLVFLQLVRVVTSRQLRNSRRYAIVGVFVAAAVLTPSQDPYSLFAMAIPMCLFYEIAIIIGRLCKR